MAAGRDTIVACATPPGQGGVGVIRLSGPLVPSIAERVAGYQPKPRYATYCEFRDSSLTLLDTGLVLYFPAPHSFTGEDVLELQAHGSPIIISCLIEWLISMGARLAEPGEFSFRAFHNEKIDLVQAEAIADLIGASSRQAALSASRSLKGDFSKVIYDLEKRLIVLRSQVEAAIDFSDEEIDVLSCEAMLSNAKALSHLLGDVLLDAKQGALLREGVQLVIAGPTNAGKSSLMNSLSKQEVSIVTSIPGTTRDVLRQSILLDGLEGLPIHCVDTAGLRESDDTVEVIGIKKAWGEMEQADIILLMVDSLDPNCTDTMLHWLQQCQKTLRPDIPFILVKNKIDLLSDNGDECTPGVSEFYGYPCVSVSVKTQEGLQLLSQSIKKAVGYQAEGRESSFIARSRHIQCLKAAHKHLTHCIEQLEQKNAFELFAEDLHHVQNLLGQIVGQTTPDDLLGEIFSTFCIGK